MTTVMNYIIYILHLCTKEFCIYHIFCHRFIKATHFEAAAVKRVLIEVTLIYLVLYTTHIRFRAALNKKIVIQ